MWIKRKAARRYPKGSGYNNNKLYGIGPFANMLARPACPSRLRLVFPLSVSSAGHLLARLLACMLARESLEWIGLHKLEPQRSSWESGERTGWEILSCWGGWANTECVCVWGGIGAAECLRRGFVGELEEWDKALEAQRDPLLVTLALS
jgi:hypothetical protein